MADYITVQQQQEQGLLRPTRAYVPAEPTAYPLTTAEQGVLSQAASAASQVIAHRQMSHLAKSEETPLHNALASLLYSVAYAVAGAIITGALLLVILNVAGGDGEIYFLVWFLLWGLCFVGALAYNRWQGLHFSPAGLEHHEIDSRVEMGKYLVDKHIELIEKRWKIKD